MLGYCWPGVLGQLLAFRSDEFVGRLLGPIEAVLSELPDVPGTWQIYSNHEFQDTLQQVGLAAHKPSDMTDNSSSE